MKPALEDKLWDEKIEYLVEKKILFETFEHEHRIMIYGRPGVIDYFMDKDIYKLRGTKDTETRIGFDNMVEFSKNSEPAKIKTKIDKTKLTCKTRIKIMENTIRSMKLSWAEELVDAHQSKDWVQVMDIVKRITFHNFDENT